MKYFVLLLIISQMLSETIHCTSEGEGAFVVKQIPGIEDTLTGCDENDADTYKKNGEYPAPCSIEPVVRTSDWLPHFKYINPKLLDDKNRQGIFRDKALPHQKKSYAIFIPALKYYVYTLEKIIT